MAAETSRSGASADSYIGSLISLTSKCEIRYEGVLYNINTEESSIGLRNVQSFGTEGRKKDGSQIPPSDKIYEYILFRGSDIKDLQVKSSPPVQTAPPIHDDPAIIQSHYSHPASTSTSLPSVASGTVADLSSHTAQVGLPRSTFQGGLPLYQPGGSLGAWGSSPSPPTANGSGLAIPMYWQGYYAPSGGLPHLQQPPLLRPPPGLPMPQAMQQHLQYPGINASLLSGSPNLPGANASLTFGSSNLPRANASLAFGPSNLPGMNASLPSGSSNLLGINTSLSSGSSNLPEFAPLLPAVGTTPSLTSTSFPSTLAPTSAPEMSPSLMPAKPSVTSLPMTTPSANLPFVSPLTSSPESIALPVSSKPRSVSGPNLAYQTISQAMPSIPGASSSGQAETSVPSLVTPGQLLQPGPATLSLSQPLQTGHKDIKVKPKSLGPPKLPPTDAKEPILPLPTPPDRKPNGAALHSHHNYRGHGRGRGIGYSRPVTRFTEDFDFTAMNEKFKKDEVWGHLGKSKSHLKDTEGDPNEGCDDDTFEEDEEESSEFETKTVYVKDDFFDSLSCNTLDRGTRNGRTKFSEQLKIDTETFGDFPRHRPSRGGGRGFRGGRTRGSYFGRGYGYLGRGRGHSVSYRDI